MHVVITDIEGVEPAPDSIPEDSQTILWKKGASFDIKFEPVSDEKVKFSIVRPKAVAKKLPTSWKMRWMGERYY